MSKADKGIQNTQVSTESAKARFYRLAEILANFAASNAYWRLFKYIITCIIIFKFTMMTNNLRELFQTWNLFNLHENPSIIVHVNFIRYATLLLVQGTAMLYATCPLLQQRTVTTGMNKISKQSLFSESIKNLISFLRNGSSHHLY